MEGVFEQIEKDNVPGGAYTNRKHFGQWVDFEDGISEVYKIEVFDPQTSGELLMSIPKGKANELINELNKQKVICANIIGEIIEQGTKANVITVERGNI